MPAKGSKRRGVRAAPRPLPHKEAAFLNARRFFDARFNRHFHDANHHSQRRSLSYRRRPSTQCVARAAERAPGPHRNRNQSRDYPQGQLLRDYHQARRQRRDNQLRRRGMKRNSREQIFKRQKLKIPHLISAGRLSSRPLTFGPENATTLAKTAPPSRSTAANAITPPIT